MEDKKQAKPEELPKEGGHIPAPPKNEMEGLGKTLTNLSDQMLRLQAEFDNYKKRTAKEKEALVHQSEAKLVHRFIPVYEELQLAEKEAGKLPEGEMKKGILLVLGKLRTSFEKEGLQEMKLHGEKFDPFRHEAAMHEQSDLPEGGIVRVIKKGYIFRGEILQHAMVSVSSGKKTAGEHGSPAPTRADGSSREDDEGKKSEKKSEEKSEV